MPDAAPDLPQLLRQADPRALVARSRIVRRVIKTHRRLGGVGLGVPHRQSYAIDRGSLLAIATRSELGLADGEALPEEVLLLHEPEGALSRDQLLVAYWQRLFHAHVHLALDRRGAELSGAALRERLARVGAVEMEEARDVLHQENLLFDPGDPAEVYKELAAVYLELRYFDPHRVAQYFPGLIDHGALDRLLAEDVDAEALFRATRLAGAPDPGEVLPREPAAPSEPEEVDVTSTPAGKIRLEAEEVSRRGNQVRAALLLERAIAVSPAPQAGALHAAARLEVEALAGRLVRALGRPAAEKAAWAGGMMALLPAAAATRMWSVEARLLYDLQKVCVDAERPLYAADLVEWMTSLFRRPIKRPLPDQPLVLVVKHLGLALHRLPGARLPAGDRQRLGELLRGSLQSAEHRLRAALGPKIAATLDEVGLAPRSAAERMSRDRLVQELLDTVCTRGVISIGDLRDAIARSRLKLPDLGGPAELARGDALLRANRELAVRIDGVYRKGEVYLRWLQSLGSVFFGTAVGRVISLYLLLPVLGSLMILIGMDEVFHLSHAFLHTPHVQTFSLWSFVGVALFLVPMIHAPPFRRAVFRAFWVVWLAVRVPFHDVPVALLRLPAVRAVLQSRPYLVFWQVLGKPLLCVAPVSAVLWLCGVGWEVNAGVSAALLVALSVVGNSQVGVFVEETAADWAVRTWQLVRDDLVPGLFASIQWLSKYVFDRIERLMYTVDEALRFRQGEGRAAFVAKLLLGAVWFVFTYLFRLIYNVFFEPQVNPIKHFPVVTVAHKVTLPLIPPLASAIAPQVGSYQAAVAVVTPVQMATPGMWGFLAWELKENWRLYRANQREAIVPAVVGSHGEWVINLLRPGFHSGTVPKLFAKLRRARGAAERKGEEGLHHVEEELRLFVERDLIAVLEASRGWRKSATLAVGHVHLATNRARVELCCPGLGPQAIWLEWANRGGWLVARLPEAGWLGGLSGDLRAVFLSALTGLYKRAGVDLVDEHLRAALPAGADWVPHRDGLTVCLDSGHERGAVYDLREPGRPARFFGGAAPGDLPATGEGLRFSAEPLSWAAWAALWEDDQAGRPHDPPLMPRFTLLPARAPLGGDGEAGARAEARDWPALQGGPAAAQAP